MDSGPSSSKMAAQTQREVVLPATTQISLNERFSALLKNRWPRPVNSRPSLCPRLSGARDRRRPRGAHQHKEYRAHVREAFRADKPQARLFLAPLGRPEDALARGAIGGRREQLLMQRDLPLEGPHGSGAPRRVLAVGMSPAVQDPLSAGFALAPQRNFTRAGALGAGTQGGPCRGGLARGAVGGARSHAPRQDMMGRQRGHFGARGRGRGRGQGRSPLNRTPLTKEQLDAELDAYMAWEDTKERERLETHLDASTARPDNNQHLDADLDANMAEADPDIPMDTHP